MSLHVSSIQSSTSLHILLEPQPDGQIRASVPALLDCSVSRATREEAIAAIQQLLSARLSTLEVLAVEVNPPQEKPWMKFAGVFKNDPDFAAIVQTLREEREIDDDSPAYSLEVSFMKFELFTQVVLEVDIPEWNVKRGTVGRIVEHYPMQGDQEDGYSIEGLIPQETIEVSESQIKAIAAFPQTA